MRTGLTNAELETVITFDKESDIASIYTFEETWQKHIEERFGIKPVETNQYGGKTYELPKDRIKMPHPKQKVSEETRRKRSAHLRELAKKRKGK